MNTGLGKHATGWRSGMVFTRRRKVLRLQWGGALLLLALVASGVASLGAFNTVLGWF